MLDVAKKIANELPSIFVGVWAILRVVGIEIDQGMQDAIFQGASSVVAFGIFLLVRRNTDGPVTALEKRNAPSPLSDPPPVQPKLFNADDEPKA